MYQEFPNSYTIAASKLQKVDVKQQNTSEMCFGKRIPNHNSH